MVFHPSGKAKDYFFHGGRPDAQAILVILTDGMPFSKMLMSTMVDRLKKQGVRIVRGEVTVDEVQ
jgi:hypothetical protein